MKMEPTRLEELALTKLVGYVKQLSIDLLNGLRIPSQHHINKSKNKFRHWLNSFMKMRETEQRVGTYSSLDRAMQVCHCLQTLFEETLTPSLVNETSAKLLETLCITIQHNNRNNDIEYTKALIQELVNTVMPRSVSKFHFTPSLCCLDIFICTRLASLTRLVELELVFMSDICDLHMLIGVIDPVLEHLIMKALGQLSNLRIFYFPYYCTDKIVRRVVECCPLIRHLDFSCSRVTEFGVGFIERLEHLEELNVGRTAISDGGMQLLTNLADKNVNLRSIGCSALTPTGLNVLTKRFQNIVCLNLASYRCILSPLKQLQYLKVLKLQTGNFKFIKEFLIISGHQLLVLELARITEVNIQMIGEFCPRLSTLKLRDCTTLELKQVDSQLPGFLNLKYVTIYIRNDLMLIPYIMSQCINVKQTTLYAKSFATSDCIENVLNNNQLTSLENLTLLISLRLVPVNIILQYLHKFTKLTILKGISTWGLQRNEVDKIISSFPSIKFI